MIRSAIFVIAFSVAGPALAGQPVELKSEIAISNGRVTLGDLFDGAGSASRVVVASGLGMNAVLDAGRVQAVAQNNGLDWDNAQGFRRIIARAGATRAAAVSRRGGGVLAYARNIGAGEVIQASDLIWSKEAVASSDAPRDSDQVIGMAAKRPLREGSAVAQRDVAAAQVIKQNDIIRIAYEADGVSLSLQAKATQPAAVGDVFSAVNPTSKKVIQAVCTGPGEAVVGPRAEQMRAAAAADPKFFASLR